MINDLFVVLAQTCGTLMDPNGNSPFPSREVVSLACVEVVKGCYQVNDNEISLVTMQDIFCYFVHL